VTTLLGVYGVVWFTKCCLAAHLRLEGLVIVLLATLRQAATRREATD
jgi:uncharacterized membrane protein